MSRNQDILADECRRTTDAASGEVDSSQNAGTPGSGLRHRDDGRWTMDDGPGDRELEPEAGAGQAVGEQERAGRAAVNEKHSGGSAYGKGDV